VYHLRGVVNHMGNTDNSGHYTADVFTLHGVQRISDELVSAKTISVIK
jgi:ubiquitin C-terminal hydrolase